MDSTSLDPEGRARITETVDRLGLKHEPVSREATKAEAETLGVGIKELHKLAPGQFRQGMHPDQYPAWVRAVRDLTDHQDGLVALAERQYAADPSPENKAYLDSARADYDRLIEHRSKLAYNTGKILSDHADESRAFAGVAADDILTPETEPAPTKEKPFVRKARNPRASDFGADNKVFTRERADAALSTLKQSIKELSSQTNIIAGVDPKIFHALIEYGGFVVEGGIRKYAPWSAHMREKIAETFGEGSEEGKRLTSDAALNTLWANVRAEANRRVVKGGGVKSSEATFAEQMSRHFKSTEAAAKFINLLNDRLNRTPRS